MASLIAKRKRRKLYYYIVESARVDGKPRIVHQTYLGTAERIAALVQDRTAPLPLSITTVDLGLPGALWRAAQQSGVWQVLESLWAKPPSGPSTAHYLLLASSPSQRAITALARQLPVTFSEVRAMSISVSTPRIIKMGSYGRWNVDAVAINTTSVARGTPAIPLLVNISASTMNSCSVHPM